MARVTYGAVVTEMHGSIGGITFQNNKSGNIARTRRGGTKQKTVKQATIQQNFSGWLAKWQTLTFTQQTQWINYAALWTKQTKYGATKTLSGINWYVAINENKILAGQAEVTTPPTHTLPIAITAYTVAITSSSIIINFTIPFINPLSSVVICTTPPMSDTANIVRSKFRVTKVQPNGTLTSINITTQWEATHGITLAQAASSGKWNISVQLYQIQNSSGINGVATQVNAALT